MKPALLRPQAQHDQRAEVRYYRESGGTRLAVKVAQATNRALDQIERHPGMGSPVLGQQLKIPGLRVWRVGTFPLFWCYIERDDHLDVIRLLGERQDVVTLLSADLTSS